MNSLATSYLRSMRIWLSIALAIAALPALGVDVVFPMASLTGQPQAVRQVKVYPLAVAPVWGQGLVTLDVVGGVTDLTGSVTITNLAPGYYQVNCIGSPRITTNYFQFPNSVGQVNATNYLVAPWGTFLAQYQLFTNIASIIVSNGLYNVPGGAVNVLEYGAVPSATVDNTAAFQAAFTAATNGGHWPAVYVPAGSYGIFGTIKMPDLTTIYSDANAFSYHGALLVRQNGATNTVIEMGVSCYISGLMFYGNDNAKLGCGISTRLCSGGIFNSDVVFFKQGVNITNCQLFAMQNDYIGGCNIGLCFSNRPVSSAFDTTFSFSHGQITACDTALVIDTLMNGTFGPTLAFQGGNTTAAIIGTNCNNITFQHVDAEGNTNDLYDFGSKNLKVDNCNFSDGATNVFLNGTRGVNLVGNTYTGAIFTNGVTGFTRDDIDSPFITTSDYEFRGNVSIASESVQNSSIASLSVSGTTLLNGPLNTRDITTSGNIDANPSPYAPTSNLPVMVWWEASDWTNVSAGLYSVSNRVAGVANSYLTNANNSAFFSYSASDSVLGGQPSLLLNGGVLHTPSMTITDAVELIAMINPIYGDDASISMIGESLNYFSLWGGPSRTTFSYGVNPNPTNVAPAMQAHYDYTHPVQVYPFGQDAVNVPTNAAILVDCIWGGSFVSMSTNGGTVFTYPTVSQPAAPVWTNWTETGISVGNAGGAMSVGTVIVCTNVLTSAQRANVTSQLLARYSGASKGSISAIYYSFGNTTTAPAGYNVGTTAPSEWVWVTNSAGVAKKMPMFTP